MLASALQGSGIFWGSIAAKQLLAYEMYMLWHHLAGTTDLPHPPPTPQASRHNGQKSRYCTPNSHAFWMKGTLIRLMTGPILQVLLVYRFWKIEVSLITRQVAVLQYPYCSWKSRFLFLHSTSCLSWNNRLPNTATAGFAPLCII